VIPFYEHKKQGFYQRNATKGSRLHCDAHLHVNIELVIYLRGRTRVFVDAEKIELTDGDVLLTFPNQIHRYISTADEHYYIFIVNPDYVPALAPFFQRQMPASARIKGAAKDPEVVELAERLCALKEKQDAFSEIQRQGYTLALFGKLLPQMELTDTVQGDSQVLKTVVSYCTQNFTKELSLGLLERELHISKYYISHLFSDKLCISFNDYINSLRVSFACRHLRHTEYSVTEIAALAGFGTPRTFNRVFQRQMGQTPSEYRRANAGVQQQSKEANV